MPQSFEPGDFLVFQLEAGFALLRVLGLDEDGDSVVWHIAAYSDFYPDVAMAEDALGSMLAVSAPHLALTDRAFASTQVARLANRPLTEDEIVPLHEWRNDAQRTVSDRSVRLLLGLR